VSALEVLVERLLARRTRVRELIVGFGESARKPFPNWGEEGEKGLKERFREVEWVQDVEGSGRV
jgi:hypothetical protein